MDESPAVAALRSLSIFGPDQAGAYREHFAQFAEVFGPDVPTKLSRYVERWAREGASGARFLTGNAGTGKTAVAEAFCRAVGSELPGDDELREIGSGRFVVKDLSGLADAVQRQRVMERALELASTAQVLVCANEGVLRDAVAAPTLASLGPILDDALRVGAARANHIEVINVNRQRLTGIALWKDLVAFVAREELWAGCEGCPFELGNCPMRANAEALRKVEVQAGLRTLVQLGAGEAVPTMREVLAILAHAITGGLSCDDVKSRTRDLGSSAFTAQQAYYALAIGAGLDRDVIERSPLLVGMRAAGLGDVADLEIDEWLRDSSSAPEPVQTLAGAPAPADDEEPQTGELQGTESLLDRVATSVGTITFHRLGEMISISEDATKVKAGIESLTRPDLSAQSLWRSRVYFEHSLADDESEEEHDAPATAARLLSFKFFPDLLRLARRVAAGADTAIELTHLVAGLNFLVTGFSNANEGLIVPDPSCLFARNPGSFRPAMPSLVQSQIPLTRLSLGVPDIGLVEDVLDVDYIEVLLLADGRRENPLKIGPRMYEAIREAERFQGPVGQGIAEMTDVRSFYGRLAQEQPSDERLRVADPNADPPALITITLPHVRHA